MAEHMNANETFWDNEWADRVWTDWFPLDTRCPEFQSQAQKQPGLYRVSAKQHDGGLVYLGQTGRSLRERLMALARNVKRPRDHPPWNDPHTAAPVLWAYRIENDFEFLVSTTTIEAEDQVRQCVEDMLLYRHRLEAGQSTLCNHGRIHPFWTRASSRARNIAPRRLKVPVQYPSLPPARGNERVLADDWLGLPWSEFRALNSMRGPTEPGVYRISNGADLVYMGESRNLRARLGSHARTAPFAGCMASFVIMDGTYPHHRKERETDLVGAYYMRESRPPRYQYGGH
jgi:hypothetical protein